MQVNEREWSPLTQSIERERFEEARFATTGVAQNEGVLREVLRREMDGQRAAARHFVGGECRAFPLPLRRDKRVGGPEGRPCLARPACGGVEGEEERFRRRDARAHDKNKKPGDDD